MIDLETLSRWIHDLGYGVDAEDASTIRVRASEGFAELPPFFIQCTESWVVLSMLEVLEKDTALLEELPLRLLEANREMRLAKFAFGEGDAVVLCAELPLESLDRSELSDAVDRLIEYATTYRRALLNMLGRRPIISG
jgi:hypothetical protein